MNADKRRLITLYLRSSMVIILSIVMRRTITSLCAGASPRPPEAPLYGGVSAFYGQNPLDIPVPVFSSTFTFCTNSKISSALSPITQRVMDKEKFEQHFKYSDSAKDSKIQAENLFKEVQETYLSKWGGEYILMNPFYYSKISTQYDSIASKYEDAIQNYKVAGEKEIANKANERLIDITSSFNKIYSLFFIFTSFYSILFIGILSRSTKAMMAYVRDTSETHMGDNFL